MECFPHLATRGVGPGDGENGLRSNWAEFGKQATMATVGWVTKFLSYPWTLKKILTNG